jgi:succinyl-CoA synthetase beta subunit
VRYNSPAKVPDLVKQMLGYKLKTKQTGEDGVMVNKVMIAEALDISKETYFAILMDRDSGGPVMVGSPDGGVDIEQVAASHPDHIFKVNFTRLLFPLVRCGAFHALKDAVLTNAVCYWLIGISQSSILRLAQQRSRRLIWP